MCEWCLKSSADPMLVISTLMLGLVVAGGVIYGLLALARVL